jgi:hypothetical protein
MAEAELDIERLEAKGDDVAWRELDNVGWLEDVKWKGGMGTVDGMAAGAMISALLAPISLEELPLFSMDEPAFAVEEATDVLDPPPGEMRAGLPSAD